MSRKYVRFASAPSQPLIGTRRQGVRGDKAKGGMERRHNRTGVRGHRDREGEQREGLYGGESITWVIYLFIS
jgi:hypothetical protein